MTEARETCPAFPASAPRCRRGGPRVAAAWSDGWCVLPAEPTATSTLSAAEPPTEACAEGGDQAPPPAKTPGDDGNAPGTARSLPPREQSRLASAFGSKWAPPSSAKRRPVPSRRHQPPEKKPAATDAGDDHRWLAVQAAYGRRALEERRAAVADRFYALQADVLRRVQKGCAADTLFTTAVTRLYKHVELPYITEEDLKAIFGPVPQSRTKVTAMTEEVRVRGYLHREAVTFSFFTLRQWQCLWTDRKLTGGPMPTVCTHGTLVCGGGWANLNFDETAPSSRIWTEG